LGLFLFVHRAGHRDWVCLHNRPRERPEAVGHTLGGAPATLYSIRNPKSAIRNSSGTRRHVSSFRFPTINHKSEGSASGQSIPLPMARVARIVTEFWVPGMPRNGATPCARRNKEFLTRGVFCLFNCCTNVPVRRVGCAHHRVLPGSWVLRPQTPGVFRFGPIA
jgi:hypothetical protein